VDGPADRPDPVLGDDEDVRPQAARVGDERAHERVDGAEGGAAPRIVRPVPLVVVVEVREVDEP